MALQYHEKSSSLLSLDQTLYSLRERDQPEWRFLQLLSARIDIHQIFVIFKTKNWFFFQFCMTLQCHRKIILRDFFEVKHYKLQSKWKQ